MWLSAQDRWGVCLRRRLSELIIRLMGLEQTHTSSLYLCCSFLSLLFSSFLCDPPDGPALFAQLTKACEHQMTDSLRLASPPHLTLGLFFLQGSGEQTDRGNNSNSSNMEQLLGGTDFSSALVGFISKSDYCDNKHDDPTFLNQNNQLVLLRSLMRSWHLKWILWGAVDACVQTEFFFWWSDGGQRIWGLIQHDELRMMLSYYHTDKWLAFVWTTDWLWRPSWISQITMTYFLLAFSKWWMAAGLNAGPAGCVYH